MPPPLSDGWWNLPTANDNSVASMSEDVAAFLMWAAEPKLMARKQAGFTAVVFLSILAVLLYLTNKRIWANAKGPKKKHADPSVRPGACNPARFGRGSFMPGVVPAEPAERGFHTPRAPRGIFADRK